MDNMESYLLKKLKLSCFQITSLTSGACWTSIFSEELSHSTWPATLAVFRWRNTTKAHGNPSWSRWISSSSFSCKTYKKMNVRLVKTGHAIRETKHLTVLCCKLGSRYKNTYNFISPSGSTTIQPRGVGAVVKISASQFWGPRFDPWLGRGLNIWVTFFPAKVHSAFHPFGVGKMSTSIHGPLWSSCHLRIYMLPVRWG